MPDKLNLYTIKIHKPHGKKERLVTWARNWFEAWSVAVNTHGLRAVYSVHPHTFRKPT